MDRPCLVMSEGEGEKSPHFILGFGGQGQAGAGLSFPVPLSKRKGQHDEEESIEEKSPVKRGLTGIEVSDRAGLRGKVNRSKSLFQRGKAEGFGELCRARINARGQGAWKRFHH